MNTFETIRDAAIAGSKQARDLSLKDGFEHGGLIYKVGNRYALQTPQTSEKEGGIDPAPLFRQFIPDYPHDGFPKKDLGKWQKRIRDAGLVSFYHCHPCIKGNGDSYEDSGENAASVFSLADIHAMALAGFRTCYMVVTCSGKVYEANEKAKIVFPAGPSILAMLGQLDDSAAIQGEHIATI